MQDLPGASRVMISRLMMILMRLLRLMRLLGLKGEELDCQDVRELSSDYLEEEITEDQAVKVRRHLDKCKVCTAFIATLKATLELLRSVPRIKAPETLRKRLYDQMSSNPND